MTGPEAKRFCVDSTSPFLLLVQNTHSILYIDLYLYFWTVINTLNNWERGIGGEALEGDKSHICTRENGERMRWNLQNTEDTEHLVQVMEWDIWINEDQDSKWQVIDIRRVRHIINPQQHYSLVNYHLQTPTSRGDLTLLLVDFLSNFYGFYPLDFTVFYEMVEKLPSLAEIKEEFKRFVQSIEPFYRMV